MILTFGFFEASILVSFFLIAFAYFDLFNRLTIPYLLIKLWQIMGVGFLVLFLSTQPALVSLMFAALAFVLFLFLRFIAEMGFSGPAEYLTIPLMVFAPPYGIAWLGVLTLSFLLHGIMIAMRWAIDKNPNMTIKHPFYPSLLAAWLIYIIMAVV